MAVNSDLGFYRYRRPIHVEFGRKYHDDILDLITIYYHQIVELFETLAENSGYDTRPLELTDDIILEDNRLA